MHGAEPSLVDNGFSPPPNQWKQVNDHEWRSPMSDLSGSPGDSLYSPTLSGPESPLLNSPPEGPYAYQRPGYSPLPVYLQTSWNYMTIDANSDTSTPNYVPYGASDANATPLSPVFEDLPSLGSDFLKFPQPFQDGFDASPALPTCELEESLLFGPTPSPSNAVRSPLPRRMTATSSPHPDMRAFIASGYDQLEVPPRRHSFNGPSQETKFFSASESSPDAPFSSFPSSPGTSEASPQLVIAHPQVASPANVQAANSRRKKPARYGCPHCKSTFTAKHNLKNHLHSHMGVRPYVCPACRSCYTTSAVQKRHSKTCHARLHSFY